MTNGDGKRLEAWRESLPRLRNGVAMSTRSLAMAAGWEPSRWWRLEKTHPWSEHQRAEVAEGVRAVASRLVGGEAVVNACVAHVLDGKKAPAFSGWLEGQCPAARVGRPKGTGRPVGPRRDSRTSREESDSRPVLPEEIRREHMVGVLKLLAGGKVGLREAEVAIFDIFAPLCHYYNKSPDAGCA